MQGIEKNIRDLQKQKILEKGDSITESELEEILNMRPRVEKLAVKDEKLRTFIADDSTRGAMMQHVYDVTYGIVNNNVDTLVLIDDSIVRGTTLRESILTNLSRLQPKKIIILSSAPQIRYPDCYGIDMSKMKSFVAFQALVALIIEDNREDLLEKAYHDCLEEEKKPIAEMKNAIQFLYDLYEYDTISNKIAEIVTPKGIIPEIEVIYQTIEGLHEACPNNNGDWYFTGNYPTQGGVSVVNRAFINYMLKSDVRAY
jgi:amidophosphoribosyltransferase